MNDNETNQDDELRQHYDLKSLQVRRLGPGRKAFGKTSGLKETETESILQTIEDTSDESDV